MGVWIETEWYTSQLNNGMSHPTWVCGLKHRYICLNVYVNVVTPYVGVWIETFKEIMNFCIIVVTPYVGVWIETLMLITFVQPPIVTPYVGVWIETDTTRGFA